MDLFDLTGKTAVVTGGTAGIGLMIARGLLQAGASVYLTSRKEASGAAGLAELAEYGSPEFIAADLSTEAGYAAASPLGRIGRADDMAGVAVYLASRAASWVTGAIIPVDGGLWTTS